MYAAWTFAGSCRENTVSGVLLVAGGILVAANGRADVRREPRGNEFSVEEKGMLHGGYRFTSLRIRFAAGIIEINRRPCWFLFPSKWFLDRGGRKSGGKNSASEISK